VPRGMGECLAYLDEWQKVWDGDCFCYEYHFWRPQYYDVGGMHLAGILYGDITSLHKNRLSGIVEDGSQRSYFPTGFPFYVYGETLFDSSVSFEELKKDYFSHAFGKDWEKAAEYLETLSRQFDVRILPKQEKGDPDALARVKDTVAAFAPVIEANKNQPVRAQTVAWRLLEAHKNYAVGLTEAVILREQGDAAGAKARFEELLKEYSEKEIYIERYFDFGLMAEILSRQFN